MAWQQDLGEGGKRGNLYPGPRSERRPRSQRRGPRKFLISYIFLSYLNLLPAHDAGGTTADMQRQLQLQAIHTGPRNASLTLLNTVSNLGGNWLATVALWLVDSITTKACIVAQGPRCRATPAAGIHFGAHSTLSILV